MSEQTLFTMMDRLRKNPELIENEKHHLDEFIEATARSIKSRITSENVGGVVWVLALQELKRISALVGIPVSDFAGYARHLRALAAAIPAADFNSPMDPQIDEILAECQRLWLSIFNREMLNSVKFDGSSSLQDTQRQHAALTSLLGALQGEVIYIEQAEHRIRSLFSPFSQSVIEPALGLSVEQILRGMDKLRNELEARLNNALDLLHNSDNSGDRINAIIHFKRLLNFSPEDFVQVLGDAASPFLDTFSFIPGSINQTYLTPFSQNEVRARPFAKLNDKSYVLFDPCYAYFAPLYRLPVLFETPQQQQKLNNHRDQSLERDVCALLEPIVFPDLKLENYFFATADGKLVERDLLLFRGGTLLLVESKAQSFQPVFDHRGDLNRIHHLVKSSIQKAYNQAASVYQRLHELGELVLYDSDKPGRREVGHLSIADVRNIFIVVCLDSYYGLIASNLTPWLHCETSVGYPWVVDRNTLETILLKINDLSKLEDFLRWRKGVQGVAFNVDEAVIAGFYVMHGAQKLPDNAAMVQLDDNYADVFEAAYFRNQGIDVPEPKPVRTPVYTQLRRVGNSLTLEVDGQVTEVIDLKTRSGTERTRDTSKPLTAFQSPSTRSKVGRNDPCPCGSGRKYKKCCL